MSNKDPDLLTAFTRFLGAIVIHIAGVSWTVYFGTCVLRWLGVTP